MRRIVLMLLTVVCVSSLFAQRNYAVGIVDSRNGKPVVGASVKILSSGQVSTTSESGNVVMLISPDDSLLVTAKGYKDRKLLMANQSIALSIILDAVPEAAAVKPKTKKPQKKN